MSDQQPPWRTEPEGFGGAPPPIAAPPIAPPPPSFAEEQAGDRPARDRPPPTLASLTGAFAGLALLGSLFAFLAEVGGDRRVAGIVISLLFEVLGVALIVANRKQRAATAGVALTAIGVIPLLVYLFVDVKDPEQTIDSVHEFTSTATTVLLVAAVLWLVAYLVGPGRRYGFYLGAALVALWLVAVVQIIDEPLSSVFDPFGTSSSVFTPVGPTYGAGGGTSGGDCTFDPDTGVTTCTGGDSDFGTGFGDGPTRRPRNPSTKLGVASLIFAGAYLALAAHRDGNGDDRQATVFFAVSVPILTLAVVLLGDFLQVTGAALLGIAAGAVTAWLASRACRRFSSWYATLGVVIAVFVLVFRAVGESARASGAVLAVVGLAAVVAVRVLEGRRRSSGIAGGTTDRPASAVGASTPPWAPPDRA